MHCAAAWKKIGQGWYYEQDGAWIKERQHRAGVQNLLLGVRIKPEYQNESFRIEEVQMHFRNFLMKKDNSFFWKEELTQKKVDIEKVMRKLFY